MRMRYASLVLTACLWTAAVAIAGPDPEAPAAAPSAPKDTTTGPEESRLLKQKLASAEALLKSGNMAGAYRAFDAVVRDPGFAGLAISDQRHILSLAGAAAIGVDKPVQARDYYRRATGMESEDPDDWYRLVQIEHQLAAPDRADIAMRHFVEHWPELLPNIDASLVPQLVYDGDPASQARYELMQALFYANWRDPSEADAIWYELAVAQVQRGEVDAVQQSIKRIDEPDSIVRLRADKRFDAIVSPGADAFDPVLAAKRKLEQLAQVAQATPGKLDPLVQLSYAMLTLGMYEQVIGLADKTIGDIVDAPIGEAPFTDMGEQIWLMNNRSIALQAMGKPDEALAELKRARSFDEHGQVNVSQALNLGDFYCRLQRPADALKEIAHVGAMAEYGRMVKAQVELCAALQLKDEQGAQRALAYLRQHEDDAPLQLLDALLRAGRMDEAAALTRKLLADAYGRGDILSWMQETILPEPLPGDVVTRENRKILLARPDVVAALEPVGRIGHFALYGPF